MRWMMCQPNCVRTRPGAIWPGCSAVTARSNSGTIWPGAKTPSEPPRSLVPSEPCSLASAAKFDEVVEDKGVKLLIEGMLIGALATNAHKGYIYIRNEYPLAIQRMRDAIRDAEAAGILGAEVDRM